MARGSEMKIVFVFCLILAAANLALAQSTNVTASAANPADASCSIQEATSAARHIIAEWKDGYNNGNAEKVAALYTPDAFYLTQHFVTGIVHGRADIRAYVQRGIDAHYHIDSIELLSVSCSGSLFYAITRYQSTNADQKAFGVNLVVAKQDPHGWRIVAHEAAVPDPATAIRQLEAPNP